MSGPVSKTVWDTFEDWCKAQMNLGQYQTITQAVEARVRSFTEQQRDVFTRLCAMEKPPEKPKDGSPVVNKEGE